VLGEEAGIAEKQAGLDVGLLRTLQEGQLHQATTANLQEQRRQTNVEHALDNLSQSISKGPGQMDPESAAKVLASAGATSHEIGVKLEQLQTLAGNVGKAFEITRADKETAQKLAADASERSDKRTAALIGQMATVAAQKSEGEKAIEATAQSLANGDLTALRDVSSMRNDARARIYARVKELNPNFSTSEVDRKITTLKSFTDGKDGQAIQSFDTFLQHAGEVTETLKGVEQSNTPAFNKPMNWWKKNMAGSPEYQRLITSIEPVGKEFEKFLLNGAALYQDDRKKIDTLLSGDSSPAQILAALNQMGKTAQDRYGAMNQRYKRVMGSDIENPFSEDAISGAQKIGVKITPGTTTTKPSGKYFDAASGKWVTQ
jgi:hypothetical protein